MPASDSPAMIVARYLQTNNYLESYHAFIEEAGLPEDAGSTSANDLTVERLLQEKQLFDKSIQFEKLTLSDESVKGWTQPSPNSSNVIQELPARANILDVSIGRAIIAGQEADVLLTSTSDRHLSILDVPDCTLSKTWPTTCIQDAPTLSQILLDGAYLLTSSMSGRVEAMDISNGESLDSRRDHSKFVVQIVYNDDAANPFLATAGWDNKINIYTPDIKKSPLQGVAFGEPIATIALPSKPESILFVRHPHSNQSVLVVSRTDSSHLHFYTVEKSPRLLGRQNLAPESNAWVAYTPSSLALCPTDHSLIAVATNSTPHMKLIIARLLLPALEGTEAATAQSQTSVQPHIEQARAERAVADKEQNAIQLHCNTMSAQTPYSTPLVTWRPDGSGVWVNSDDGVIRGIDITSGKVVSTLKGHDDGAKVRTLWAGFVEIGEDHKAEEWLISGGFDQKLIVWKP